MSGYEVQNRQGKLRIVKICGVPLTGHPDRVRLSNSNKPNAVISASRFNDSPKDALRAHWALLAAMDEILDIQQEKIRQRREEIEAERDQIAVLRQELEQGVSLVS